MIITENTIQVQMVEGATGPGPLFAPSPMSRSSTAGFNWNHTAALTAYTSDNVVVFRPRMHCVHLKHLLHSIEELSIIKFVISFVSYPFQQKL